MIGLTIYDYVLFPLYLYLVIIVFKKMRNRYKDDEKLFFYFTWGFRIKIAMIVVYTLLANYIIRGDAVDLYFGEGAHFKNLIINGNEDLSLLFRQGGKYIDNIASEGEKGYLALENNYMVVKVGIVFCMLTFSCFLLINLLIGFIAFLGSWQLYLFFRKLYPDLHKQLAIACMGIPTVLFWSSGIGKDAICMASIGFLTKSFYDIFLEKRNVLFNTFIILLAIYLIYSIKSYIIISYLPPFLFFLTLYTINKTKNELLKVFFKIFVPLILLGSIFLVIQNSEVLFADYSSEKILDSVSKTQDAFTNQSNSFDGAFFTLGEFNGSFSGLIKMAPLAIITTFFRPFLWECRNLIMYLSALESLLLLFFTLSIFFKRKGLVVFIKQSFTNPAVFYCLSFSLIFATFIGITTFNFGSLVRYKIPCTPFFVISLIIINYVRLEKAKITKGQTVPELR